MCNGSGCIPVLVVIVIEGGDVGQGDFPEVPVIMWTSRVDTIITEENLMEDFRTDSGRKSIEK